MKKAPARTNGWINENGKKLILIGAPEDLVPHGTSLICGTNPVALSPPRVEMEPSALRTDACSAAGVAFFHKQWGHYGNNPLVLEQGLSVAEARAIDPDDGPNKNGKGGALLDERLWREFPKAA